MKVKDYISTKFQSFGISLSEADLVDITLSTKIDLESEISNENKRAVEISMAGFIPALLLRANWSQGDMSESYNSQGVKDYYSYLCKLYGLKDQLSPKPTVTFR
ncbi:DUF6706 family protein [Dysgonomonas macrotermitis]|uniref:Uncharacterized protein n=1 Tax=Dysgonomonas macrotermitis TaxID=1346286 RepID=A0A1M5IUA9_9BACT|nr:DUF6706 family protein [Dysgonomonas macrotermitis]SHG31932.1 hypothetical protein SAMN05444362_12122 [Dysgonomonas macrotermitis]